jgi:hypothetical protein
MVGKNSLWDELNIQKDELCVWIFITTSVKKLALYNNLSGLSGPLMKNQQSARMIKYENNFIEFMLQIDLFSVIFQLIFPANIQISAKSKPARNFRKAILGRVMGRAFNRFRVNSPKLVSSKSTSS